MLRKEKIQFKTICFLAKNPSTLHRLSRKVEGLGPMKP
jgi:hypothetical protein